MTCLTNKLKDIPCILCQQADQVYIGHGKARFCAHCTITWDPVEDNSPIESKSVIFADDAVDGKLPQDVVERMGVLAGSIQTVFAFEDRLTEVMSIPEALFTENEGLLKHKPGRHDQRTHGQGRAGRRPRGEGISGSKVSPEMRVWQGQQHEKPDNPLTKLQQGELGERIAMKALSDKYGVPFEGLNVGRNNAALDVKGDHLGVEVKAGMGYNGERSRSWRSKLGEAGPLQKKRLADLPPEQRKAELALKRTEILKRKADMLQQLSSEAGGERFTGKMVGVIMTPDGRSADAFEIDGFHLYLGWGRHARPENYLGTYEVGQDVFDAIMSKAIRLAKAITRESLLAMEHPLENIVRDYELDWFTPAQVALLRYPIIWWSLEAHEADTIDVFTTILLGKNVDPETITEAELTALWNVTFPEMHTEPESMLQIEAKGIPTYDEAWCEFSDDLDAELEAIKNEMLDDYEAGLLPPPVRSGYQKAAGPSWQEMVIGFSRVMALVHLVMRMNEVDIESLYNEMYKARKAEFDDAVSDYLAQMDCGGKAYLKAGSEMKLMKAQSRLESEGIAETYNRDLAKAILAIRQTVPNANRHTYASQLRTWEAERRTWKLTQISLHTILTSRDQALKAFSDRNGLTPDVELYPKQAAEPVCQGWINRGVVSYQVAKNNPSPYHVGCLHYWRPKFTKGDCENLWIG